MLKRIKKDIENSNVAYNKQIVQDIQNMDRTGQLDRSLIDVDKTEIFDQHLNSDAIYVSSELGVFGTINNVTRDLERIIRHQKGHGVHTAQILRSKLMPSVELEIIPMPGDATTSRQLMTSRKTTSSTMTASNLPANIDSTISGIAHPIVPRTAPNAVTPSLEPTTGIIASEVSTPDIVPHNPSGAVSPSLVPITSPAVSTPMIVPHNPSSAVSPSLVPTTSPAGSTPMIVPHNSFNAVSPSLIPTTSTTSTALEASTQPIMSQNAHAASPALVHTTSSTSTGLEPRNASDAAIVSKPYANSSRVVNGVSRNFSSGPGCDRKVFALVHLPNSCYLNVVIQLLYHLLCNCNFKFSDYSDHDFHVNNSPSWAIIAFVRSMMALNNVQDLQRLQRQHIDLYENIRNNAYTPIPGTEYPERDFSEIFDVLTNLPHNLTACFRFKLLYFRNSSDIDLVVLIANGPNEALSSTVWRTFDEESQQILASAPEFLIVRTPRVSEIDNFNIPIFHSEVATYRPIGFIAYKAEIRHFTYYSNVSETDDWIEIDDIDYSKAEQRKKLDSSIVETAVTILAKKISLAPLISPSPDTVAPLTPSTTTSTRTGRRQDSVC